MSSFSPPDWMWKIRCDLSSVPGLNAGRSFSSVAAAIADITIARTVVVSVPGVPRYDRHGSVTRAVPKGDWTIGMPNVATASGNKA